MVAVMVMVVLVLTSGIVLGMLTKSNGEVVDSIDKTSNVRAMTCVVVAEHDSVITVEDETHNLWLINDEGYNKGDVLCVWFNNMRTPKDLTDDEVINYCECDVD